MTLFVMQLTIDQAAARLGKSARQIRYLIQTERLPARKLGGTWIIESENLPLSPGQEAALERRGRQFRSAVEQALDLPDEKERPSRYSVNDLKAFQIALPLFRSATDSLGSEHPATRALRQSLEHLARGCHRFERSDKATAYRDARDAASLAVCELILAQDGGTADLVTQLEQNLMGAFAGLLRRVDRRSVR